VEPGGVGVVAGQPDGAVAEAPDLEVAEVAGAWAWLSLRVDGVMQRACEPVRSADRAMLAAPRRAGEAPGESPRRGPDDAAEKCRWSWLSS
jgi:hypothetical protein